jgi:hypothetical protein
MGSVINSVPSGYPAFGEYTEPPSNANQSNICATGVAMRTFFPVSTEPDRDRYMQYNGLAQVVDTRVVCMSPILSELTLTGFDGVIFPGFIEGRYRTNLSAPGFQRNDSGLPYTATFKCAFPSLIAGVPTTEWPLSVCNPDYLIDDLMISPLVGGAQRPLRGWGNVAFLMNMTGAFIFPNPGLGQGQACDSFNITNCPVRINVTDVQQRWPHCGCRRYHRTRHRQRSAFRALPRYPAPHAQPCSGSAIHIHGPVRHGVL